MSKNDLPIISLQNVHFYRGEKEIFKGINLEVPRNKITAIMGPSGTGKTTLLNLIGGGLRPNQGTVTVDGQNLSKLSRSDLYKLRRQMGVMFQGGALFTDMNVFENVAFSLREHTQLPEDMIRDLVLMMLEAVGLRGAAHLEISQLSGGMARRVALARSVIISPKIMMYDEPFTGQDPIAKAVLLKLVKQMNDALSLTSVIVSHDVLQTAAIADHIYIIYDGKVIAEGGPQMLMEDSSEFVRQFIDGKADGPIRFHYPAKDFQEELL